MPSGAGQVRGRPREFGWYPELGLMLIASTNRKMTAAGTTSMEHSQLAGQPSRKAVFWEIRY